jgi:hypothetical protein
MAIFVRAKGAAPEECRRGAEAAQAVFDHAGISAWQAARGMSKMEAWDIGGFVGELSEKDAHAADAWLDAEIAAYEACCRGWAPERERPVTVYLELLPDPLERARRMRH